MNDAVDDAAEDMFDMGGGLTFDETRTRKFHAEVQDAVQVEEDPNDNKADSDSNSAANDSDGSAAAKDKEDKGHKENSDKDNSDKDNEADDGASARTMATTMAARSVRRRIPTPNHELRGGQRRRGRGGHRAGQGTRRQNPTPPTPPTPNHPES